MQTASLQLDIAGRKRSPATMPGYHAGARRATKYAATQPTLPGWRRSWPSCVKRARASVATESRANRGAVAGRAAHRRSARAGRGRPRPGSRRTAGAPRQGRQTPRSRHGRLGLATIPTLALSPRPATARAAVLRHPWSYLRPARDVSAARACLRRLAFQSGVRRRFAPHQLRHAHAIEMAQEGVPLNIIQRQLGHTDLGVTSIYLQGIDNTEIINTIHARRPPMMPASAGLTL